MTFDDIRTASALWLREQSDDSPLQIGQFVLDNIPDGIQIDAAILVDQHIAKPATRRQGISGRDCVSTGVRRFADDFEIAYHAVLYQR